MVYSEIALNMEEEIILIRVNKATKLFLDKYLLYFCDVFFFNVSVETKCDSIFF